ncbi:homocysteine S-methyltransferase [Spongisporangium articulatum]|uniref:Homocysteine S-methyltransferase n=1 Tax=Spongisporangium articulatum TaxID=3362603 RepID=A0ABW8AJN9_9ACTN
MYQFADALARGPVVLDGGLGVELERRGHDLSGGDWSARILRDDPDALVELHADFLAAGAQVTSTATYQAGDGGLIRAAVDAARAAIEKAGRPAWVVGALGPYGALLGDLSEFTGTYLDDVSPASLAAVHRPRVAALVDAGADVIGFETLPARAEAEVAAALLTETGVPGWVSLTTVTTPAGEVLTRRGEPAAEVYAALAAVPEVVAVGVNCTDPAGVPAAVRVAAASGVPVVVYPNGGQDWTDGTPRGDAGVAGTAAREWLAAGARGVGGCCGVGPDLLELIAREVS